MSVGVWEPGKKDTPQEAVAGELLEKFLALAAQTDEQVTAADLEGAGVANAAWVMTAEEAAWQAAADLDDSQLESLARFFTVVEQQAAGWDAGKTSPVIPLVKVLKSRDAFTPELRKWIKAHTDNRYLPHGSAL